MINEEIWKQNGRNLNIPERKVELEVNEEQDIIN